MEINRLWRRILSVIGRGSISFVDDSKNVQFVQLRLSAQQVQSGIPRLAEFGFTSNPPNGTDAVAVFLAGERSNGVVIATGHQQYRPKGLRSGEAMVYDAFGNFIRMGQAGIQIHVAVGALTIETPGVGAMTVNGHVMDETHQHVAVQPGSGESGGVV